VGNPERNNLTRDWISQKGGQKGGQPSSSSSWFGFQRLTLSGIPQKNADNSVAAFNPKRFKAFQRVIKASAGPHENA
jgi:hypothetical protein